MCKNKARLDGKVVIVTGGSSGIGKAIVTDLAKRGAHVIIAYPFDIDPKVLVTSLIKETNNKKIEAEKLDLASFASVRDFVDRMNKKLHRLDILMNNAGLYSYPYGKTVEGVERHFGVNYLGHFLLTNLLLDLIKKTPSSRIINTASFIYKYGKIHWDDINLEKHYHSFIGYTQSKLAVILFTKELANKLKGTGITAVCFNPGLVRTNIMYNFSNWVSFIVPTLVLLFYPLYWCMSKSAHEGAQTAIFCAVDENIEKYSGKYLNDCAPVKLNKEATEPDAPEKLWNWSIKKTGI